MEACLVVFQPIQQFFMPDFAVPSWGRFGEIGDDVLVLGFFMVPQRHRPTVKDVHKRFEAAAHLKLFGRLAGVSCLGANRVVDEIHDINRVIELSDFRGHRELPSQP
jgi:hypothetical protein